MKSLIQAVAVAAALAVPALSFAQSAPLSRAEVRAQLVQVEQAGYNPAVASDPRYPADAQAAEARVGASSSSGYGGVADGASASGGSRAPVRAGASDNSKSIYFGS